MNDAIEALESVAYMRGRRAARDGLVCHPAPYQPGSTEERQYIEGWNTERNRIEEQADRASRRDRERRFAGNDQQDRDVAAASRGRFA